MFVMSIHHRCLGKALLINEYPQHVSFMEKLEHGIMDRFFKKVNQKVNLGQRLTPAHPPAQTLLL